MDHMKVDLAPGWKTELDRGPDWLFVTLYGPDGDHADARGMAESLSMLMHQEMKGRLVLELQELFDMPEDFVEELIQLRDEVDRHGGIMRLCGLAAEHQQVLGRHDTGHRFTPFRDREEAILGFYRPGKPR
jgi:anti-anti-sigma regulatory factor